jgi:hypothetical protein
MRDIEMINKLRNLAQTGELIEFHLDLNDLSTFGVGKVLKVSDEWGVIATISPDGMYDGYGLIRLDDIIKFNVNTKHIVRITKLYTLKNQKHSKYDVEEKDLLLGFLQFAQKNNFIVSIRFINNEYFDVQGYVKQVENDLLVIQNVTKFGEYDGESYFKLENIDRISCDDQGEHCIKILSSDKLK